MENRESTDIREFGKKSYPAARTFLERVRIADRKVEDMRMRIENLRMLLTDRSVHLSNKPRGSSPDQQRMQTVFAEIDALEREKAQAEAEAEALRIEVGRMICQVSDPHSQKVLMMYYLDHLTWNEISDKVKYSRTQMHRFTEKGYTELENILKDGTSWNTNGTQMEHDGTVMEY